ncbi:hypothetical protein EUA25_04935, partial [Neisseria meningitidis]
MICSFNYVQFYFIAKKYTLLHYFSVFSDKFLKLKISSFLQKQKTKIRNLKFVIPAQAGIQ